MNLVAGLRDTMTRNFRQMFRSPACWVVILIVAAIHLTTEWQGGPESRRLLGWYLNFGLSREGFLGGKFWTVFSYGLLHGSWWHLGMNALFVLFIGSRIEFVAGAAVLWRALVFGIAGGGICHLLLTPANGSGHVLVGLSGGCLALILLLTTLSPRSRMMPLPVSGRSLGLGLIFASLLLSMLNLLLSTRQFAGISEVLTDYGLGGIFKMGHACHLGGAIAGWLYGRWLLRPRISLESLRSERMRREVGK